MIIAERYPDPEDGIFNRVIFDISIVLRETTLTVSDSIETVKLVSLSTTEITQITRLRNGPSGYGYIKGQGGGNFF